MVLPDVVVSEMIIIIIIIIIIIQNVYTQYPLQLYNCYQRGPCKKELKTEDTRHCFDKPC